MAAATAILRSRDCLHQPHHRFHHDTHRRTTTHFVNPNPNLNFSRSRRRKRSPTGFVSNKNADRTGPTYYPPVAKNLVMGQVKILKRGEPLPVDSKQQWPDTTPSNKKIGFDSCEDAELILCSTGRLGPEPETVQKQINASDFYAGSAPLVASPPPSSLPFPALLAKKEKKFDLATSDLLRLLRLDLPA